MNFSESKKPFDQEHEPQSVDFFESLNYSKLPSNNNTNPFSPSFQPKIITFPTNPESTVMKTIPIEVKLGGRHEEKPQPP